MRYTWENDKLAFENISTFHQIGKKTLLTPFEKMRNKKAFQSNVNRSLVGGGARARGSLYGEEGARAL